MKVTHFISKNPKSKALTGMSKDILQTYKLNQTFVIDTKVVDYS